MITTAIKRGGTVYVYGEKGGSLFTLSCSSDCELLGYTSNTVTLKRGHTAYIYNEKGQQISVTSAS